MKEECVAGLVTGLVKEGEITSRYILMDQFSNETYTCKIPKRLQTRVGNYFYGFAFDVQKLKSRQYKKTYVEMQLIEPIASGSKNIRWAVRINGIINNTYLFPNDPRFRANISVLGEYGKIKPLRRPIRN